MRTTFVAVLAVSLLVVAACSGDDDSSADDTGSEATTETTIADDTGSEATTATTMADDTGSEATTATTMADGTGSEATTETTMADDTGSEGGVTVDDAGRLVPVTECAGDNVASDADGVTEDSVNVTTLSIDFEALADIGFAASDRDPNEVFQVFADEVNENGGVCGRTLDVQQVMFNILAGEGGQACVEATEDRTNLVVNASSYNEILCLTDAGVPAMAGNDLTVAEMERANGILLSRNPSVEDQYRATVQVAESEGLLDGKVGLWYGSVYPNQVQAVEDVVFPMLDEMGVDYVAFKTEFGGPNEPAGNQALVAAATEFVSQQVDTVLMMVQNTNHVGMQTELDAQGLNPQFISMPISANVVNELFAERFGTREIADGQQFVTFTIGGTELDDTNPIAASCHEIWTRRTGEEVEQNTFDYTLVAGSCVHVDEIVSAISLAGGDLTRASFVAGAEQLPPHRYAVSLGDVEWSPDNHFGPRIFAVQDYDGESNTVTTSSETFTPAG